MYSLTIAKPKPAFNPSGMSGGIGTKKPLENASLNFGGNTNSCILDFQTEHGRSRVPHSSQFDHRGRLYWTAL
jgi:hypothetical protein